MHNIKINNKSNNTKMTYIGLEPKSFHTNKYSQPFELILFHATTINIKFHKGFYYSPLLNNYLFNYLIFLGLTECFTMASSMLRWFVDGGSGARRKARISDSFSHHSG